MKARMPSPLPASDWPATDKLLWNRVQDLDPLAPGGNSAAVNWRASTKQFVEGRYGAWLAWLNQRYGIDDDPVGARVTEERLREYLEDMSAAGLADYTRANSLQGLSDALRVMCPSEDFQHIARASRRISAGATRVRDLAGRLRSPSEVYALARDLMEQGVNGALPVKRSAISFRDGLLIALWVHRPLRIANLSQIHLGKQLIKLGHGHRLEYGPDEMKQRRRWQCSWPSALESGLETYLEIYRPVLLSATSRTPDALWVSQFGDGMPAGSIAQVLKLRTQAAFGTPLNPHLMRYIAATRLAEASPATRADVAAILGHRSLQTSERHYILASGAAAAKAYGKVISEITRCYQPNANRSRLRPA